MRRADAWRGAVQRVRLRWRDGDWTVERVVTVADMTLPAAAELPPANRAGHSGFWIELRHHDGALLHRTVLHDPLDQTIELHGRGGRPRRLPSRRSDVLIDVPLPDDPGAAEIRIFGQRRTTTLRLKTSQELARLRLPTKS